MNLPKRTVGTTGRLIILGPLLGLIALLVGLSMPISAREDSTGAQSSIWSDIGEPLTRTDGARRIVPSQYRTVRTDFEILVARLGQAPAESSEDSGLMMYLPLPNGRNERFWVYRTSVMAPELAAKFPEIMTYIAIGVDDAYAAGRLDHTPRGFHAMITSLEGTFYVDPYRLDDTENYISYYKTDHLDRASFEKHEPLGDGTELEALVRSLGANGGLSTGDQLRTYRLALATTGEYAQFHGGTVPLVMAEIVTAINRVTGIFEREVAIRMELVANNDQLIFLDPDADPYSNSNGIAMLGQNVTELNNTIGSANYDIGHVFSTGGGGIAYLGVICGSLKAGGVTGLSSPVGDPFYVDYVSHEMGHQFGANHTFNGTSGACGGGNRHGQTAHEPGSGTTIMAYAGICASQDIQAQSDDYFQGASFDEIVAFTTAGTGNNCASISNGGNSPPSVDAGTGGYTIPAQTPFTLTGSASDPDGDSLTFNWEEFDLGPAGGPNNPAGSAPIFRSFPASVSPSRTFPQISDIVNGTQTIGEILPTYTRSLNFRLTARDNHLSPSAGGVSYDSLSLSVVDQADPFMVTAPDTPVTWSIGAQEMVTWTVADTDLPPISCSNADIRLSTDGGYTFPDVLADDTPNDGSQSVTAPIILTTTARVKVECSDNIFFDISNSDFEIDDFGNDANVRIFVPTAVKHAEMPPVE